MKKTYSFLYFAMFVSASLISQTTQYIGVGHTSGVTVTTSVTSMLGEGVHTINASGMDQHLKNASRFLGQTTTGVNFEYIESVSEQDFGDGIDAQRLKPKMNPYVR